MKEWCERILAAALAVVISISLLPVPVMAAGGEMGLCLTSTVRTSDIIVAREENNAEKGNDKMTVSDAEKGMDDSEDDKEDRTDKEDGEGSKDEKDDKAEEREDRKEDDDRLDEREENGNQGDGEDHQEGRGDEDRAGDSDDKQAANSGDKDRTEDSGNETDGRGNEETDGRGNKETDDRGDKDRTGDGSNKEADGREDKGAHGDRADGEGDRDDREEDERRSDREDRGDKTENSHKTAGTSGSGENKTSHEEKTASLPKENPESSIQHMAKKEKNIMDWGKRIDSPEYAMNLYDILSSGANGQEATGSLVQDSSFILPAAVAAEGDQDVIGIECVKFDLAEPFEDGDGFLAGLFTGEGGSSGISVFQEEDFYRVDPVLSDRQVDYASLEPGDVVRTAVFNGIFVTSIPKDTDYDEEKKLTCSYISTVYQAFDRDHPEVFWLSGKCSIRIPVVCGADGTERAYFFLVLTDKDGFTMRAPDWTAEGAVAEGIQRREEAIEEILGTVTSDAPGEMVRQLNAWLTEHNEYNTTEDLTTIGNEPHECLSALEGREGKEGPVCDGYSRAFKVLCDRLDIPCILENGYAKVSPDDAGTFHMWNAVEIDNNWYGADITWNDPIAENVSQTKSGKENEQYLLVGSATVIRGMAFEDSHPATNQASFDGVAFDNGPLLCNVAYAMPFSQVSADMLPCPILCIPDGFDAGHIFWMILSGRVHRVSAALAEGGVCGQILDRIWTTKRGLAKLPLLKYIYNQQIGKAGEIYGLKGTGFFEALGFFTGRDYLSAESGGGFEGEEEKGDSGGYIAGEECGSDIREDQYPYQMFL